MLQEYEETLDIQERDLKLKWEQEDFQFPEVQMMTNYISSKIHVGIKIIQLYFTVELQIINDVMTAVDGSKLTTGVSI